MQVGNPNDGLKHTRTAAEAGWHVSRYNVTAQVAGSKALVVYNTYRRTCAEYSPIELYVMGALDEVGEDNPFVARSASRGLIANFDEREAYIFQRRLDSATPPDGDVHVTICPTLACNFECTYCFATRGRGKMSLEVQEDVVDLVGRMIDVSGAKGLTVTWFGGEPLLATDVIEALSPRLRVAAEERGCNYKAWIFTNGYFITPEVVDLLERCGVGNVHVPLDGVGDTNDATRRLVGGGPTFDRIVNNFGLLRPPIQTLVRANVHEGNVGELDELKAVVTARAEEAGTSVSFYPAAIVDCGSNEDESDSPMTAYAYHGDAAPRLAPRPCRQGPHVRGAEPVDGRHRRQGPSLQVWRQAVRPARARLRDLPLVGSGGPPRYGHEAGHAQQVPQHQRARPRRRVLRVPVVAPVRRWLPPAAPVR